MIMCILLYSPVSSHMSQLLSTGRPISSVFLNNMSNRGWVPWKIPSQNMLREL